MRALLDAFPWFVPQSALLFIRYLIMAFAKLLHLFSVLIWVGGMFFAYMVLRPAAVETLEPPHRLRLWVGVFRRFFQWVWGAIALILLSGFYMLNLFGGMASAPLYVHLMLGAGSLMMLIYGYVFFACYRPMSGLVSEQRWPEAGAMLGKIRQLVAVNLSIGIALIALVFVMRG